MRWLVIVGVAAAVVVWFVVSDSLYMKGADRSTRDDLFIFGPPIAVVLSMIGYLIALSFS